MPRHVFHPYKLTKERRVVSLAQSKTLTEWNPSHRGANSVSHTRYQRRLEIKDSHSSFFEGSGTNHCCGTFVSGMLHFTQLQVTEQKPLAFFCHRDGNPVSLPSFQIALTASFPVQFSLQCLSALSIYFLGIASQEEGAPKHHCPRWHTAWAKQHFEQPVHLWLDQSAGMISGSFLLCCDCSSSYDMYSRQSCIAKGYFRPNEGLLSTFRLIFIGANLYWVDRITTHTSGAARGF